MSEIQAEQLTEDLKALEDAFAQYSESLVTRRLVRDLGASRQVLAAIDQDIDRLRGRYESARETSTAETLRDTEPVLRWEFGQELDELLLARRREDLRARAREFLPDGALLWLPATDADTRRSRFLSGLAAANENRARMRQETRRLS